MNLYGGDETRYFIVHGLCSNTGGGGLEVDVTGAANTGIEGLAAGHEREQHGSTAAVDEYGRQVGGRKVNRPAVDVNWHGCGGGDELWSR